VKLRNAVLLVAAVLMMFVWAFPVVWGLLT